jgi:hypothetical protein
LDPWDGGDLKLLAANDTPGAYLVAPGRLFFVRQLDAVGSAKGCGSRELTRDPETLSDSVDVELVSNFAGLPVSTDGQIDY